ncbi:hypothetical protein ES708_13698 [subsurface metagenome]
MSDIKKPVVLGLRRTWRNASTPVNGTEGTLAGVADPGDMLIDIENTALYQNTNTKASPTWSIKEPGIVQYAAVEISSADLLGLVAAPKTLVATPGAGKVLEFVSLLLAYNKGAITYTVVEGEPRNLAVRYTDADGDAVSSIQKVTDFLDQETDQVRLLTQVTVSGTESIVAVPNAPFVLTLTSTESLELEDGNGTIHAKIAYTVHSTGL